MDFIDEPKPITAAQKQAMARLYADEGIRSYFMHVIQKANHEAMLSLHLGDTEKSKFYANRFTIVKQLLEIAKHEFVNFETRRTEKERVGSIAKELEEKQLEAIKKV